MSGKVPETIFVIVDKETGSIKTGGGSSTPASVHAYEMAREAWLGVRRIGRHSPSHWRVARYRLVEVTDGV